MFILRVDLKNGLHLEYNYARREAADEAHLNFQMAVDEWSIADEHGRVSQLMKAEVVHVMVADLEQDVRQQVALGMAVDRWKQDEAMKQQRKLAVPASGLIMPRGIGPVSRINGLHEN